MILKTSGDTCRYQGSILQPRKFYLFSYWHTLYFNENINIIFSFVLLTAVLNKIKEMKKPLFAHKLD